MAYIGFQVRSTQRISVAQQLPFAVSASEVAPASFDLDPRGPEHAPPGAVR
jgi:hypothetical protein